MSQYINPDALKKYRRDDPHSNEALRSAFKDGLTKLLQINTREQAIKDLKGLILQNKTTFNLRIWLSVLTENRSKHNQSQINILAFIIQQYGKGLLDPLDKVPSLEKTVFRVTELLVKFFNEEQQNVSLACQRAWIQLYLTTLNGQDVETKKKLLYNNIEAILNGGADKISQMTAQLVLDGLLETTLNKEDHAFFKEIAKRALVLFLKTTINCPSSLSCLQTILGYFNIMNLLPLVDSITGKILSYISSALNNSVGYKIKSEACNALALIGEQIDNNGVATYQRIVKCLQNLATDKVWAVQVTGRKALNIWKKKKKEWDDEYIAKNQQFYQQEANPFKNNQNNKSRSEIAEGVPDIKYKTQQNNWVQPKKNNNFPTQQNFYKPPPYQQEQIPVRSAPRPEVYQAWNPQALQEEESKQIQDYKFPDYSQGRYLHKNTGVGGGNTVQSVEQYYERQRPQQTYSKKMQEIKKSIFQAKQDYTQYDETMPWQQAKDLPKVSNDVSKWKNIKAPPHLQVEPQQPNLADAQFLKNWQKIIELYEEGKKQQSVKALLQMDDDIYFLRFLLKYGKGLLKDLTRQTSAKVLKQMLSIKKTNFMQQLFFKLVGESAKGNVGQLLSNRQNLQISKKLEACEKIQGLEKISSKLKRVYQKSLGE